jgi:hypothetical protein
MQRREAISNELIERGIDFPALRRRDFGKPKVENGLKHWVLRKAWDSDRVYVALFTATLRRRARSGNICTSRIRGRTICKDDS